MILNSYAKLNLYLEVVNKRKDSYHNIETLFERISLADKIVLKLRKDKSIKVTCNNPAVPEDKTNLCYVSAELLQEKFNIENGIDIKIIKRIPVGAGLGGGSSNAATVLLGLNKLWKLNLSQKKLGTLGRLVGADVPFFIYNAPFALGEERGDKIRPLRSLFGVRLWHILVVPRIKVSTPLIYNKWDEHSGLTPPFLPSKTGKKNKRAGLTRPAHDVKILTSRLRKNSFPFSDELLFNSLEAVTIKLYPQVKRVREKLGCLGLKSILMSGSGPAVFGIVSSKKEAVNLGRKLRNLDKSWQIFAARTL